MYGVFLQCSLCTEVSCKTGGQVTSVDLVIMKILDSLSQINMNFIQETRNRHELVVKPTLKRKNTDNFLFSYSQLVSITSIISYPQLVNNYNHLEVKH